MKVALIGGGLTYTPQLVNGFLARVKQLPVSELWLMDIDAARLVALQAPPDAWAVLLGKEACGLAVEGDLRARPISLNRVSRWCDAGKWRWLKASQSGWRCRAP